MCITIHRRGPEEPGSGRSERISNEKRQWVPESTQSCSRRSVLMAAKPADFFKTSGWAFYVQVAMPMRRLPDGGRLLRVIPQAGLGPTSFLQATDTQSSVGLPQSPFLDDKQSDSCDALLTVAKAKQLGRGFLRQTICSTSRTSLMRRVQEILPVGTAVGLRAAPKGH